MTTDPLTELEERLGYTFQDRSLLRQALVHPSYAYERHGIGEHNQRLEFLGDAVLGMVVSEELYRAMPEEDEGDLSRRKHFLVKGESLALLAVELDLPRHMLLGKGERSTGGAQKRSNLEDCLEAILAAMFLDGGLDPVRGLLAPWVEGHMDGDSGDLLHTKTRLMEAVQAELKEEPTYQVLERRGPPHEPEYLVAVYVKGEEYGRGWGRSKKAGGEEAARLALARMAARGEE